MATPDAPAPSPPPATPSRRGLWIRLVMALVLAGAFVAALWPYLRAVPRDLSVPLWVLPAYLATLVPYTLTRAGRWHALVRPLGAVTQGQTLRVSLAGYMWIALLPFRLGELARPLFLAQCSDITMHRALGTVAIERVLDGLVICGLFFAATAGRGASELGQLQQATIGVMALFTTALMVLVIMARWPRFASAVIDATVGRVLPRLGRWAANVAHGVAEGLSALPSGRALSAFVGVTLVYWACNAAGMWVLAHGCGLPLSLADAVLVMATMNIALLVPGGPAQLGIFQTGVALGLHLVLPGDDVVDRGSTFAFYLYTCQLGVIVLGGLWAQRSLGLDWRAVVDRRASRETPGSGREAPASAPEPPA